MGKLIVSRNKQEKVKLELGSHVPRVEHIIEKEVIREVPVDRIVEVPIIQIQEKIVTVKEQVEVVREIRIEVPVEIIKEVVREVPVEIIKEVLVEKIVIKNVEIPSIRTRIEYKTSKVSLAIAIVGSLIVGILVGRL